MSFQIGGLDLGTRMKWWLFGKPETFVMLSYYPLQGKYGPNERRGFVTEISALTDAGGQFTFYDTENERDIEVRISRTTSKSTVRSRKDRYWRIIGTPLRVSVFPNVSDPAGVYLQRVDPDTDEDQENNQEHAVVAAAVRWNTHILEWFEWSEANI